MKILAKNSKQGAVSIQTQSQDDIWTIFRIVQPSDEIAGWTERKIKIGDSTTQKAGSAATKRMHLTIILEKISYEADGKSLRLLGPIKEGNEYVSAGEYHSFSIDEKSDITIIKKEWPAYMERMIEEAVAGGKGATIIAAFDRNAAVIGSMTAKGFTKLLSIEGTVQKKGQDPVGGKPAAATFYGDIVTHLVALDARVKPTTIILASSNFWKDPLFQQIDTQARELRRKTKWIECDDVSENAIAQLVSTKEFQHLTLGQSQADIYNTFEEVLKRISTEGAATYGVEEVKKAIAQAAVSSTLVSVHLVQQVREKGTFDELESMLRNAEQTGATVHIVGEEFHIIDKIDGLGGIVALLRYKIA